MIRTYSDLAELKYPIPEGDFVPLGPGASAPLTLTSSASAKSDSTLGWLVVALDDANGALQANLVALPTKL